MAKKKIKLSNLQQTAIIVHCYKKFFTDQTSQQNLEERKELRSILTFNYIEKLTQEKLFLEMDEIKKKYMADILIKNRLSDYFRRSLDKMRFISYMFQVRWIEAEEKAIKP